MLHKSVEAIKRFFTKDYWYRTLSYFKVVITNTKPLVWFFLLNILLIEIKTYIEYWVNFNLGVEGPTQNFLLFFNPIPTAIILFSVALYFRGKKAYWIAILMNLIQSIWLFANILYYREFSDFLSFGIMGTGSSTSNNLDKAIMAIMNWTDFLVFADIIVLVILLLFKQLPIDYKGIKRKFAVLTTLSGFVLVLLGYGLATTNRSGLLTRTFDNNYLVKYLGLNEYAVINAFQTHKQNESRNKANEADLKKVKAFTNSLKVPDNPIYFGKASGKNVIIIHLESFQQFLLGYKVDGQEVTPNLNKFIEDNNTLSFDNFYGQVGQGKTSDAEMMLENGLYGLPTGSAMTKYGTNNTFTALPGILHHRGYTSASFHGDVASFWNRANTYKSWGYDYYFSKEYYKNADKKAYNIGYGMKDKIFLKDSIQYLEKLPQPFYAKLITVTNHYPYDLDKQNIDFPATKTGDKTVDGYVQTAHYLDETFGELLNWLKETGLYDNSLLMLYGDHYGISENHKPAIAQLLGKDKVTEMDLANWQKVPFILHMPGLQGGINHTYGGEIDVMPTMMDLLGIKDNHLVIFGQDLLSSENSQLVPFRNGSWVTPSMTKYGGEYFDTQTGERIKKLTASQKKFAKETQEKVDKILRYSDEVITGDLLRFDKENQAIKIDKKDYDYQAKKAKKHLDKLQKETPSSLYARNNYQSTVDKFHTDAPELK